MVWGRVQHRSISTLLRKSDRIVVNGGRRNRGRPN